MKVTFDIPDNTITVFMNIMTAEEDGFWAKAGAYSDEQLVDGAEIKVVIGEKQ